MPWRGNRFFYSGTSLVAPQNVGVGARVSAHYLLEADGATGVIQVTLNLQGHGDVENVVVQQQLRGWRSAHQLGEVAPNAGGPTVFTVDVAEGAAVRLIVNMRRGAAGAAEWPLRAVVDPAAAPVADHFETALPGTPEPNDRTVAPAGRGLNNAVPHIII